MKYVLILFSLPMRVMCSLRIFTLVLLLFLHCIDKSYSQDDVATSYSERIDSLSVVELNNRTLGLAEVKQKPDWQMAAEKAKELLHNREVDEAIKWAKKSDSLFRQIEGKPLFHAQLILGTCYKDKGELAQSLVHYQLALEQAPSLSSEINTMFNMSEVSLEARDTLAVRRSLKAYVSQIDKVESMKARAYYYFQYASLLQDAGGDLDTAFSFFKKSLEICRAESMYDVGSYNCCGIINQYKQKGEIDNCYVWEDSLAYYVEKDNTPLVRANALQCVANLSLSQKDYQKAIEEFNLALVYAKKSNYMPIYQDVLLKLSEAYEANGEYKKSIGFLKKYNTVIDSLGSSKWNERLLELQMKYENDRKEQQVETLHSRLKASLRLPGLILFATVLMGLFATFLLLQYRKRQKKPQTIKSTATYSHLKKNLSESQLEIWENLQRVFMVEKLYTKSDLTLTILANRLNTNRSTLSEIINVKSGKTFTRFINEYRVKEACHLLTDPKKGHLTIEGIGQDVGFNSRSAFYSAFTYEMKQSPAGYRKRHTMK